MQKNCSASRAVTVFLPPRRPARVVEEARLESVYTGNRIEGSNPSVSAKSRSRMRPKRSRVMNEEF